MRFTKQTLSRLTGLSTPFIGLSWNPPAPEVVAARRVITYLEDRRVLYEAIHLENTDHCISSVMDIRQHLTAEIGALPADDPLAQNLLAMRAACRRFLRRMQSIYLRDGGNGPHAMSGIIQNVGDYRAWIFLTAIGELRAIIGVHVAIIAARNHLDVEDDLAGILPGEVDDDGTLMVSWEDDNGTEY